jgi:hypothetical protein
MAGYLSSSTTGRLRALHVQDSPRRDMGPDFSSHCRPTAERNTRLSAVFGPKVKSNQVDSRAYSTVCSPEACLLPPGHSPCG